MKRASSAGFTLLEVLIAIVVMGFLLVALSQGTRFGLRAWDSQARLIEQRGELDAVDRALRRLIVGMYGGSPSGGPTAAGNARSLTFISELPMAGAALASRRADMLLNVDARHRLMLHWRPHLHVQRLAPPPALQDEELLRGVARLELAYWRHDGRGGWLAAWSERELPALIRIRLVFEDGDRRSWPDIVAAPELGPHG